MILTWTDDLDRTCMWTNQTRGTIGGANGVFYFVGLLRNNSVMLMRHESVGLIAWLPDLMNKCFKALLRDLII